MGERMIGNLFHYRDRYFKIVENEKKSCNECHAKFGVMQEESICDHVGLCSSKYRSDKQYVMAKFMEGMDCMTYISERLSFIHKKYMSKIRKKSELQEYTEVKDSLMLKVKNTSVYKFDTEEELKDMKEKYTKEINFLLDYFVENKNKKDYVREDAFVCYYSQILEDLYVRSW